MAEVQALMPNGTYRALIAQRELTLALPFSAKAGDSLELEVVESDGKISLAFIGNRTNSSQTQASQESVTSSLSQTGKLIGNLLSNIDDQGKKAAPAALNGNQALLDKQLISADNIAPILKDALTNSGVFYEAHQARWVAGELPTEQLLKEPQGRLSTATPASLAALQGRPDETPVGKTADNPQLNAAINDQAGGNINKSNTQIPGELVPLVQQQLDALATQTYAWQGQIWPEQQMSWEIEQQGSSNKDDPNENHWQTRLKLTLPHLGGIDASLRLSTGNQIEIALSTDNDQSESRLLGDMTALKQQFEAAGLSLVQFKVKNGVDTE